MIVDAKLGDYLLKILVALVGLFGAYATGMGLGNAGTGNAEAAGAGIDIFKVFLVGLDIALIVSWGFQNILKR